MVSKDRLFQKENSCLLPLLVVSPRGAADSTRQLKYPKRTRPIIKKNRPECFFGDRGFSIIGGCLNGKLLSICFSGDRRSRLGSTVILIGSARLSAGSNGSKLTSGLILGLLNISAKGSSDGRELRGLYIVITEL